MEAEEYVYRALGVPGIVAPTNRPDAAVAHLLAAWGPEKQGLEVTGHVRGAVTVVVDAVAEYLRNGHLDAYLGSCGEQDAERVATEIATSIPPANNQSVLLHAKPIAQAAVEKLRAFSRDHPEVGW